MSNRLPFVLCRRKSSITSNSRAKDNTSEGNENPLFRKPSAGGLVTAVAPVIVQSGGT